AYGRSRALSSACHDAQVVDEPSEHLVAILGSEHRARVDRRDHEVGKLGVERLAALLRHLEALAEERLGCGGAEQDERAGFDELELRVEPGTAGHHLCPARLVVDAPGAARLPLEVL